MGSNAAEITTLVFDLDNVLYRYDFLTRLRLLAKHSGLSPTQVKDRIWNSCVEGRAKLGKTSSAHFIMNVSDALEKNITETEWVSIRRASMVPNIKMIKLAKSISKKYPIYILSNNVAIIHENLDIIVPELSFIPFDRIKFSFQYSSTKPDCNIFNAFGRDIECEASNILFIDDLEENVAGARLFGWNALIHKSYEQTISEMSVFMHDLNEFL